MPSHSCPAGTCPRKINPASVAIIGCTLMNTPKNRAGTCRSATRSIAYGTAEASTPAVTAYSRNRGSAVSATDTVTGRKPAAQTRVAVAVPVRPGIRAPTRRFSRMYAAQPPAASRPQPMPIRSLDAPGSTIR